ncbi:MAG: nitrite/sulfite reductase [Myxococcota bacterium]
MYRYNTVDHEIVEDRVAEFRDQVARRLAGDLTEDQFRPLRLMNGLYLQLHGYMLRVAIPYGTLSSTQLRALAGIARDFDKGYGHFTTRQNIQFNWPKLVDVPDILARLASVEMHAIQTSGNCIRNVTSDPYAGAARDELEDPRITSEIIRQWSTFHPEFSFLPRKFKIAVTASEDDRAAIAVHDIGIKVVKNESGEIGYQIWVGGGQGRTPYLAKLIRPFLPRADLLSYIDAIMRVYNAHGRRDNKYKARIKILVQALGARAFTEQVEQEWRLVLEEEPELKLDDTEWNRVAAFFAESPAPSTVVEDLTGQDPSFKKWRRRNTHPHRVEGRAIAVISLKPHGGIPGDASAEQMDAIADLADRYSEGEIRVTHQQNLVLPHVAQSDLPALWKALDGQGLATANLGLLSDIIACPGLDYCNLANARAIPIAQTLSERFADREDEIGELSIKISGCINACGHHHVGNIGILGIDKRGVEAYQIAVGGDAGTTAALAKIVGPAVAPEEVPDAIERLLDLYVAHRRSDEDFMTTLRRVGIDTIKEGYNVGVAHA